MVWLHCAPIPAGGRGSILRVQIISTCRRGLKGRGEGVGTLWFYHSPPDSLFPSRRDVLVKCSIYSVNEQRRSTYTTKFAISSCKKHFPLYKWLWCTIEYNDLDFLIKWILRDLKWLQNGIFVTYAFCAVLFAFSFKKCYYEQTKFLPQVLYGYLKTQTWCWFWIVACYD